MTGEFVLPAKDAAFVADVLDLAARALRHGFPADLRPGIRSLIRAAALHLPAGTLTTNGHEDESPLI